MTTNAFDAEDHTDEHPVGEDLPGVDDTDADQDIQSETDSDIDTDADSAGQPSRPKKVSGSQSRRSNRLTKKQVESILVTRSLLDSASEKARSVAAALTGADDSADLDALTVAVATADRAASKAAASLTSLAKMGEVIDRVVAADSWDKPTTSAAWRALRELGLVSSALPQNETKAAAAIAKSADDLGEEFAEAAEILGG